MARHRIWILALGVLCAGAATGRADDAQKLADRIDELIAKRWAQEKVHPAPPADDAMFLRRLSLDLAGKIPPVSDARHVLAEPSADKRRRAIDRLLDSPGYVTHFSNVWRDLLMPEVGNDFQRQFLLPGMETWLQRQFADNVPYDRMVRELLTVPFGRGNNRMNAPVYYGGNNGPNPTAFYQAKEGKPENLAAATARLFLGVRLECAQCHDHPFGRWTREQFWGQAAFFAGIRSGRNGIFGPLTEVPDRRELAIPGTERVAQARFLDGKEPRWKFKTGARTTLVDWMTAADNPFFARAAVNRLWAHFFGVGIVEPVDDFSDVNVPSHPELLDELAREFVAHGFDLKFLIRAITLSKTYQLSSVHPGPVRPDVRLFARMPVKGLSPDQLFDSLVQATGYREPNRGPQRRFFQGTPRREFMDKFTRQDKATEFQTSIPQALTLMNNRLIIDATHPERGEVFAAVAGAPFLSTPGRIEALFLATLSRKPRPDEAEKFLRYVEKGGGGHDSKKALADVYWALLNSTEFLFNH